MTKNIPNHLKVIQNKLASYRYALFKIDSDILDQSDANFLQKQIGKHKGMSSKRIATKKADEPLDDFLKEWFHRSNVLLVLAGDGE